ncbi:hypothetical protein HNQ56_002333 [Anaerotaenia torta]
MDTDTKRLFRCKIPILIVTALVLLVGTLVKILSV